jgi:hypothetical protein
MLRYASDDRERASCEFPSARVEASFFSRGIKQCSGELFAAARLARDEGLQSFEHRARKGISFGASHRNQRIPMSSKSVKSEHPA